MLIEGHASSIGELVEEVRRVTREPVQPDPKAREEIWFRGQSSCEWTLTPNLYRVDIQRFNYVETTLIDRFVSLATPFAPRWPLSDWEWYFLNPFPGLRWKVPPAAALPSYTAEVKAY